MTLVQIRKTNEAVREREFLSKETAGRKFDCVSCTNKIQSSVRHVPGCHCGRRRWKRPWRSSQDGPGATMVGKSGSESENPDSLMEAVAPSTPESEAHAHMI